MRIDRQWQYVMAFLITAMWVITSAGRVHAQTADLSVVNVDVSQYPQVALTVDVPDALGVPSTATIEEDGVPRTAVVQAGAQGAIEVVLALDTSGSMAGAPMEAAKAAASTFVRQLPAGARAAVIGFSNNPYVVSPMTDDRAALAAAIDGVRASGETALYDALDLATTQFSLTDTPRSVVLVSDGGDTRSASTLEEATTRLVAAKARLFALRMTTSETNDGALEALATASHGRAVDGVNAADLSTAYQQIAGTALHEVRITYHSAGHGAAHVHVDLTSGNAHSTATVAVQLPDLPPATTVVTEPSAATPSPTPAEAPGSFRLVLGGGALFLGLLVIAYTAFVRPPKSLLATNRHSRRSTSVQDLKGRFGAAMERSLERRGRRDVVRRRLENAGIGLRPGEYLVLVATAAGGGFFVGLLFGGGALAIVFALLVVVGARVMLGRRTTKRRAMFEQQLPDLLQQLTATLRAGYGIMQALDSVGREMEPPMCDEIRRVVHEVQLGRPLTESLETMSERVGCEDFTWVVQAIEINAEVGGDLVEVLEAVAGTIRARAHLRRQIRTLSAQGRLSAKILFAMPFFMAALLSLIHPGYLAPLATGVGPILLVIGAVLMTVGALLLRRIVRLQF